MNTRTPEYIKGSGACIVSRRVMDGTGRLKWMTRAVPSNLADTGWRFLADTDDEDFINDPANMLIRDYNAVAEVEPAIIPIYSMGVGSDLQLIVRDGKRSIVDNRTGLPIA